MKIEQFKDNGLSHYSFAILSECENKIVLIDPARDIAPYLSYAKKNSATIIGVIETHPHADFVSGHLELHQQTGATIYCSQLSGALYPHQTFDSGDAIEFGNIKLKALNTPGHSMDSISIVLEHQEKNRAVFTGDTLFIGDCGRPDLREKTDNQTTKREEQAKQLYHSLREKLMVLDDEVWVYPAHGAGTLCGKALSDADRSTIGAEKRSNWSLQEMTEEQFVKTLLEEQPFIPSYFAYDVELNTHGAKNLQASFNKFPIGLPYKINSNIFIVDTRPEKDFKNGHLPKSVNIQNGGKFETWLGSIFAPEEFFYLVAESDEMLKEVIGKTAKIGYELFIEAAFVIETGNEKAAQLDLDNFKIQQENYTIIDVRNKGEVRAYPYFDQAINIPLYELRTRLAEIPSNKPILVHCAGGYRSVAGSSIIENAFDGKTEV